MIMAGIMVAGHGDHRGHADRSHGRWWRRAIVTITLNRPERKNAINGVMWDELLATFREIAAGRRPGGRPHRCRRRVLLRSRPVRRGRRHRLSARSTRWPTHAPRRRRGAGPAPPAPAHHRQGGRGRRRCRRQHGLQLRPHRRLGRRPLHRDLRPPRPHHRLRRLVGAASAGRPAQGQGAGVLRRHHLGQGGRGPRRRQPGGASGRARRLRGRMGPAAGARTADRARSDQAPAQQRHGDDHGAGAGRAKARAQTVNFATADTAEAMAAFLAKRDPRFDGR